MKGKFFIDCNTVTGTVYGTGEDASPSILVRLRIWLHLWFCPDCPRELDTLYRASGMLKSGFFPPAPDFAGPVMERLRGETGMESPADAPAGFSFRGWVITGCFVLLALPSSFFGMNFTRSTGAEDPSFLLPLGLTIGMVLTCYGALFIASHLKELSTRFRLRQGNGSPDLL